MCCCGWSHQEPRQGQNARAAVAKLQAAIARHFPRVNLIGYQTYRRWFRRRKCSGLTNDPNTKPGVPMISLLKLDHPWAANAYENEQHDTPFFNFNGYGRLPK
jgi:hypothetical protein